MQEELTLRGECLCGAVQYECQGTETSASYCHCPDCRKATGGPYTVGVGVEAAYKWIGTSDVPRPPARQRRGFQISRAVTASVHFPLQAHTRARPRNDPLTSFMQPFTEIHADFPFC